MQSEYKFSSTAGTSVSSCSDSGGSLWKSFKYDLSLWCKLHTLPEFDEDVGGTLDSGTKADNAGNGEGMDTFDLHAKNNILHGTLHYDNNESPVFKKQREFSNFWDNYFAKHWTLLVQHYTIFCFSLIIVVFSCVELSKFLTHAFSNDPSKRAGSEFTPELRTQIEASIVRYGGVNADRQGTPDWWLIIVNPVAAMLFFLSVSSICFIVKGYKNVRVTKIKSGREPIYFLSLALVLYRILSVIMSTMHYPARSPVNSLRCQAYKETLADSVFGKHLLIQPVYPLLVSAFFELIFGSFLMSIPVPSVYYHPTMLVINIMFSYQNWHVCQLSGLFDYHVGLTLFVNITSLMCYAETVFKSYHAQRTALMATRTDKVVDLFMLSICADMRKPLHILSVLSMEKNKQQRDERNFFMSLLLGSNFVANENRLTTKAFQTAEKIEELYKIMNGDVKFDHTSENIPLTKILRNCAKEIAASRIPKEFIVSVDNETSEKCMYFFDYLVCFDYSNTNDMIVHTSNSVLVSFINNLLEYLLELYDDLFADGNTIKRSSEVNQWLLQRIAFVKVLKKYKRNYSTTNSDKNISMKKKLHNDGAFQPLFTISTAMFTSENTFFQSAFKTKVKFNKFNSHGLPGGSFICFEVTWSRFSAMPFACFKTQKSSSILLLKALTGMSGGFIQNGSMNPTSNATSASIFSFSYGSSSKRRKEQDEDEDSTSMSIFSAVIGCSLDPKIHSNHDNHAISLEWNEKSQTQINKDEELEHGNTRATSSQSDSDSDSKSYVSVGGGLGSSLKMRTKHYFRSRGSSSYKRFSRKNSGSISKGYMQHKNEIAETGDIPSNAVFDVFIISNDKTFNEFVTQMLKNVKVKTQITYMKRMFGVNKIGIDLKNRSASIQPIVFATSKDVCVQLRTERFRGLIIFCPGSDIPYYMPSVVNLVVPLPCSTENRNRLVKFLESFSVERCTDETADSNSHSRGNVFVDYEFQELFTTIANRLKKMSRIESFFYIIWKILNYIFVICIEFPLQLVGLTISIIYFLNTSVLGFIFKLIVQFIVQDASKLNEKVLLDYEYRQKEYQHYHHDSYMSANDLDDAANFLYLYKKSSPKRFTEGKVLPIFEAICGFIEHWTVTTRIIRNEIYAVSPRKYNDGHDANHQCSYRRNSSDYQSSRFHFIPRIKPNIFRQNSFSDDVETSFWWNSDMYHEPESENNANGGSTILKTKFFGDLRMHTGTLFLLCMILGYFDEGYASVFVNCSQMIFPEDLHHITSPYFHVIVFVIGLVAIVKRRMIKKILLLFGAQNRIQDFPIHVYINILVIFIVSLRGAKQFSFIMAYFSRFMHSFSPHDGSLFALITHFSHTDSAHTTPLENMLLGPKKINQLYEGIDFLDLRQFTKRIFVPTIYLFFQIRTVITWAFYLSFSFRMIIFSFLTIYGYCNIIHLYEVICTKVLLIDGVSIMGDYTENAPKLILILFLSQTIWAVYYFEMAYYMACSRSAYQSYRLYHFKYSFLVTCQEIWRTEVLPSAKELLDSCDISRQRLIQGCASKAIISSFEVNRINQYTLALLLLRNMCLSFDLAKKKSAVGAIAYSNSNQVQQEIEEAEREEEKDVAMQTNILLLKPQIIEWINNCKGHICFHSTQIALEVQPDICSVRINKAALKLSIFTSVMTALDNIYMSRSMKTHNDYQEFELSAKLHIRVYQYEQLEVNNIDDKLTSSQKLKSNVNGNEHESNDNDTFNNSNGSSSKMTTSFDDNISFDFAFPSFLETRRLVVEVLNTGLTKDILYSVDPPLLDSLRFQRSLNESEIIRRGGLRIPLFTVNGNAQRVNENSTRNPYSDYNFYGSTSTSAFYRGQYHGPPKAFDHKYTSSINFSFSNYIPIFQRNVMDELNALTFGQLYSRILMKNVIMDLDKDAIFGHVTGTGKDKMFGNKQIFSIPYQLVPLPAQVKSSTDDTYTVTMRENSTIALSKIVQDSFMYTESQDIESPESNRSISIRLIDMKYRCCIIFQANEPAASKLKVELYSNPDLKFTPVDFIDLETFLLGTFENIDIIMNADCIFVPMVRDVNIPLNKLILAGLKATLVGVDLTNRRYPSARSHNNMNDNAIDIIPMGNGRKREEHNTYPAINTLSKFSMWTATDSRQHTTSLNKIKYNFTIHAAAICSAYLEVISNFCMQKFLMEIFSIHDDHCYQTPHNSGGNDEKQRKDLYGRASVNRESQNIAKNRRK